MLLGCDDATVEDVLDSKRPPKFEIKFKRSIQDVIYCLEGHFDGYKHGLDSATSYTASISPDQRAGRFSVKLKDVPIAIFGFQNDTATLNTAKLMDRIFINHIKNKDFIYNQSREKCIF